ncbi:Ig-like domain-containing protein [Pelistega ratti]|uniref:Ig-like domain-containing protein n=1 Tax=Pelistega ratti TaxID=2652177 RepID=UPI001357C47C|nr:Ig-like domain-containing protein [Pelistega ratti]
MSVTLKVLSAKKVIANHNINQGEVLVIDARANSNYQLIDDATGFGPQNIIAKRSGKDLQIFLEDGNLNADIVIQGYYGDDQNEEVSNLLVGQHENGNIYAYVPESGEKLDAVSMLADEVAAPQALGGEELSSAFWAFNPWWLLALVPIAGIAIAAGSGGNGGGGKGSPADTTPPSKPDVEAKDDGSVVVTPKDDSTKTTVDYTKEDGTKETLVVEKDPTTGKWVDPNPNDNITVNPDTGIIIIPENNIKGGTDVTAKTEDTSGNKSDPTTVEAKDTDAPSAPDVEAKDDGSVVVTPKDDATKTTVDYTDEDGKPSKVVAEKDPETGKWEIKEKPEGSNPTIDPETGVITIPENNIKGGTDVTAKTEDPTGNESEPTTEKAKDTDKPPAPDVEAKDDGSVVVTPKDDASKTTVDYTDEDGKPSKVVAEKDPETGKWEITEKPEGSNPTIDPETGVITIPENNIKGGTDVTAKTEDPSGNKSDPTTVEAKDTDAPSAPNVEAKDDGSVVVTPKDDASKTTVDYTKEDGKPETLVVEKDPTTGKWVDPNPNDNITVDPETGVITIPENNIKGGTDVTAKTEDPSGNKSDPTTVETKDTDNLPKVDVPENSNGGINAEELKDGVQVEVTPPKNNTKPGDKVVVELKDKDGNPVVDPDTNEPVKVEKEIPEGWTPGTPIEVTIPKDKLPTDDDGKVKDGDYTVVGKVEDPEGNVSKETDAPISIDTKVPGDTDGNGEVDDKDDSTKDVTLPIDKDNDGNNDTVPANTDGAPNIVFGEDKNSDGKLSGKEVGDDNSTPVFITIPDGTEKGDTLVVTINGVPKKVPVTEEMLEKGYHQEDVPVIADTTAITVTAKVKDPAGNESKEGSESVTVDTTAPSAPKEVAIGNGDDYITKDEITDGKVPVNVGLPDDAKVGDKVVVTPEKGEPVEKVLTKDDIDNGKATVEVPAPNEGEKLKVDAKVVDEAGNEGLPKSDEATRDTKVPGDKDNNGEADEDGKPVVAIQDGGDEKLNDTEVTDGQAKATITFPADAGYEAGDTLTVTNPDGTTQTFTLTADEIANGKEVSFPVVEGQENVVKAKVTDPAGNSSLEGEDRATVDTKAPSKPTSVEIGNGDDFITPSEVKDGKVPVNVGLPDDAKVGDKVVVTPENGEPVEKVLTKDDIDNGKATVEVPAPNEGEKLKVDAKVVDEAGNEGLPKSDEATRDTKVPGDKDNNGETDEDGKPVVTIQDGGDEKLNSTEVTDGQAKATITFPVDAGYEAGDTLTVTNPDGTTQTFTLTADEIANGKEVSFPVVEGQENVVKAKVTDPAGNSSLEGEDRATVDTKAPSKPTSVEIGNGDDFITPSEVKDGKVPVNVGLPDDAKVGDKVVVTPENGEPVEKVLTKDDIDNGKATVEVPAPNEGEKLKVDAKVVDEAGNEGLPKSDEATRDTKVPGDKDNNGEADEDGKPVVAIQDGGDEKLNDTEVTDGQAKATITFPADAGYEAGDTLTVTNPDGTTQTFTLTADEIANGKEVSFPVVEGQENVVKAKVTDPAGNSSLEGEDRATVDTKAPSKPTSVEIGNGDDFITPSEVKDGKVPVNVGLPDDAKVGDKVVVTPENGEPVEKVLTKDDIDNGKATVEVPAPNEGEKLKVDAKVVDEAGNEGLPKSDEATRDTKVPGDKDNNGETDEDGKPVVTIQDGGDEKLNSTEVTDGQAKATITFPVDAGYEAGDTLTVTNPDGTTQTFTLTADEIANGKEVSFPVVEGQENVVKAKVTDPAGNSSLEGEDRATVDTKAPSKPTSVEIGNGDDFITPSEVKDGKVPVNVGLPDDAKVGDKVVVTPENGEPVEKVLTKDDIDNGKATVEVPAPNEGEKLKVDAKVVDEAGNEGLPKSDEATRDTKVPGDTDGNGEVDDKDDSTKDVTLPIDKDNDGNNDTVPANTDGAPNIVFGEDKNSDGKLSGKEVGDDNSTPVFITIPDGTEKGDTLVVTINGVPKKVPVTEEMLEKGYHQEDVPVIADTTAITVTAKVKDPAGNESKEGSESVTVDTTAPSAPKEVAIGNGDDYITKDEITDGKVPVNVGLPDDAKVGDKVVVTPENGEPVEKVLTKDDIDNGKATVEVPAPNEGEKLKVDAKVVDEAGNEGLPKSDEATRDTKVPGDKDNNGEADEDGKPVVAIQDGGDDKLNDTEVTDGQAKATITFPADAGYEAGDTLTVTNPDGTTQTFTLTADEIANGKEVSFPVVEGQENVVKAKVTDPAGNSSLEGEDRATVDTKAPSKPTSVEIGNGDDFITPSEVKDGKVPVNVGLPDDAKVGDKVVVTPENGEPVEKVLTKDDIDNGKATVEVPAPNEGEKLKVDAKVVDEAGNEGLPKSDEATRDTKVPGDKDNNGEADEDGKPVVAIQDGGDEKLNDTEVTDGQAKATITFPADAGYEAGDTLTVTNPDGTTQTFTLTADEIANGKEVSFPVVEGQENVVKAKVTDPAGNSSLEGEDRATVDTKAPSKPTSVEIGNGDDFITPSEVKDGKVPVNVGLPDDAKVGDKVVVTPENGEPVEKVLTKDDIDNGKATVEVPAPNEGEKLKVDAKVVDEAGNEGLPKSDEATRDTKVPGDKDNNGETDEDGKPVVTIQDGGDEKLNSTEVTDGQAKATITFPVDAGYEAGDTLTVTNPDGTTQTFTLTADEIANGKEVSFPVVEGQENVVKAKVTDPAGNSSLEGEDRATVDTKAPSKPTSVEIGNGDDFITPSEVKDGKVPVNVGLPDDAKVGDKVVVTPEKGEPVEKVLTKDDIDNGKATVEVPAPNEGEKLKVDAKVVDEAGNEGLPKSDEATRDTKVPGDTDGNGEVDDKDDSTKDVTLPIDKDNDGNNDTVPANTDGAPNIVFGEDKNSDGKLSGKEVGDDNSTPVFITIPDGTEKGDTLVVTINGVPKKVPVTEEMLEKGYHQEDVPVIADTTAITVTAKVKDPAGNESKEGSESVTVDTTAPSAPKEVAIGNGDDYITKDEITDGKVPVNVGLPDDAKVGDKVVVTPENGEPVEKVLTKDDIDNGKATVEVPAPNEGEKLKVDAKVVDEAGNEGLPKSDEATRDTKVPGDKDNNGEADEDGKPVVTIQDGGDDKLNDTEVTDGQAKATITFPADAGYEAGDTLTVTNPDGTTQTFTLTADEIANGKEVSFPVVEGQENVVKAKVTDPAGNSSLEGEDRATVDTKAPSKPTSVEIGNGDDFITPSEVKDGKVPVNVGLPDDAKVGDKVVVTPEKGEPVEKVLTKDDIDNGKATVEVPAPNEGEKLKVDAKVVDEAGNEGLPKSDEATRDTKVPGDKDNNGEADEDGKPVVAIQDGGDEKLNDTEVTDGQAKATITFPADAGYEAGDTLTVTNPDGTTQTFTLTADEIANGKEVSFPVVEGQENVVKAKVTDPAGNSSLEGEDRATVDTKAPSKPTSVEIGNGDDFITPSEVKDGKVPVNVGLPDDAKVGDKVVVTPENGEPVEKVLTKDDIDNGKATVEVPAPNEGEKLKVDAKVVDEAGNEGLPKSDEATRDTKVPGDKDNNGEADEDGKPVVTIQDGGDDKLNDTEVTDGQAKATITFPADAGYEAGDTLTVTNPDGTTQTFTLTADEIANGKEVSFPVVEGQENVVKAKVTDPAGNSSLEGEDRATVDTKAPSKPTSVEIGNGDDFITPSEVKDGKVPVNVGLPDDAKVGDKVVVTPEKGEPVEKVLTKDDIDNGKATVEVPAPNEGEKLKVDAKVVDEAGNEGLPKSDEATRDTKVPGDKDNNGEADEDGKPVVAIQDGGDEKLNSTEVTDGQAKATITFPVDAGYEAGDTLTVTNPDGTTQTFTLTADEIANGKEVSFPVVEGQENVVKAKVTDPAGNSSLEGEDRATVDTKAPSKPTSVEIGNGDDFITPSEVKDGKVPVTVGLPDDAKVGDKVVVTPENGEPVEKVLTKDDIDNGKATVEVPAPNEGEKLKVNATVKDPAGNESTPVPDEATRDTTAPDSSTTTITVDTVAGDDNKVDPAEAKQATQTVTGNVTGEFKEGDAVVVKVGDEAIGNGTVNTEGTFSIDVPTEKLVNATDKQVTATVTATDAAGNKGDIVSAPKPYEVGSGRSAPTVIIGTKEDSPYGDNVEYLTKDEITTTGSGESAVEKVSVKIAIPADAQAGDTLTLTTNTDTAPITYTVQAADIGQTITQSVTAPADGAKLNVSATITAADDASVMSTAGKAEATRDTSAAIGITIGGPDYFKEHLDSEDNGVYFSVSVSEDLQQMFSGSKRDLIDDIEQEIYSGEVNKEGKMRLTFDLPKDAKVGETLSYEVNSGGFREVGYDEDDNYIFDELSEPHTLAESGSKVLDAIDIAKGSVDVLVTAPRTGGRAIDVKVTLTDALGNVGEATESAVRNRLGYADTSAELPGNPAILELSVNANDTKEVNGEQLATAYEGLVGSQLTYTVSLSEVAQKDYKVAIQLTGATTNEYTIEEGANAKWYPNGMTTNDGARVDQEGSIVVVTVFRGEDSAHFTLTPKEDNTTEGTEVIEARIARAAFEFGEAQGKTGGNGNFYVLGENISTKAAIAEVEQTPPTVSITVKGDITEDVLYPATEEDTQASTGLTYTVSVDQPKATDTVVKVKLTGKATAEDYTVTGENIINQQEVTETIGEGDETKDVTYKVIEVKVPAGQTSASFIVNPIREEDSDTFNFEGSETVIATIQASTDDKYTVGALDNANNSGERAIGLILDANPVALPHLNGDMSLAYGESASHLEKTYNKTLAVSNTAKTVSTDSGKDGAKDFGDAIIMTDRGDKLYIGYYSNAAASSTAGNFANWADTGSSREKADGDKSLSTIDTGKGDDIVKIRGKQLSKTRLYLGEGNDTYELGDDFADTKDIKDAYIFAEAGDDTIKIGTHSNGYLYTGSGSDTVTVGGIANGDIDLGSGRTMPSTYLPTYQDGSGRSLGNDNNTDLATHENVLVITGTGTIDTIGHGSTIYGGAGKDIISIEKGSYVGDMDLANGDNKVTIKDNLGTAADGGTIKTGDGNDQITIEGNVVGNSKIETGAGNDTVTVGGDFNGTFNGGEGNDTLTVTGAGRTINFANILNVETIDLNGSGANTLTNVNAANVNKSADPIYIKGGADDKVNIGYQLTPNGLGETLISTAAKTWSKGATVEKDGISYDTWSLGDGSSTIYIQQGVEVI